jgi:pectin methylesterase-like acyl-CoA thioesterase
MHMKINLLLRLTVLFVLLNFKAGAAEKYDMVVARDGSGNYTSVQAAIDAAPEHGTIPFKIFIKSGKYTGQVVVPATKPFIELVGENPATTIISYGDGKAGTAAFIINADDCLLMNITLENSQGYRSDGPQSLAVKTNASHAVFYNCRFISGQDTVLISRAGSGIYFKDCYIDGNTDFIYGAAVAVFDHCVIYARDRIDGNKGGYITAANTPAGQTYGLVFRDCIIPGNHGITTYTLGRPWQNDSRSGNPGRKLAENKVVFLNTIMGASISPAGWSVWDAGTKPEVITYAEYKTRKFDGTPADISKRVAWSKQLAEKDVAAYYNNANLFGEWDPYKVWEDLRGKTKAPAVTVTNFLVRYKENEVLLQFNTSWPLTGVVYTLYKSEDRAVFKKTDRFTAKSDTTLAFQFKDHLPATGQVYYYRMEASKGKTVVLSDTLTVNLANIPKRKNKL